MENPYTPPQTEIVAPPMDGAVRYADFWSRLAATLIDAIFISLITVPLTIAVYGLDGLASEKIVKGPADVFISWILPILIVVLFWMKRGATPGKIALKIRIISADGRRLGLLQCIVRYIGYIPSAIALFLGYLWMIWDPKNQTWHDKMANTIVVRD